MQPSHPRVKQARQFCQHIARQPLPPLHADEPLSLCSLLIHGAHHALQAIDEEEEEENECERFQREYVALQKFKAEERAQRLSFDSVVAAISEEDRRREVITTTYVTKDFQGTLQAMTENYVYVTYFRNSHTKRRVLFNLPLLAAQTLQYGAEFSQNKFAKVTWRFLHGPSVLLFASGAMVMTGAHGDEIREKVLQYCMEILRKDCHYASLEIQTDRIENIVIKGTLSFGLCLNLLAERNPESVRYDAINFSGAIIEMKKLEKLSARLESDASSDYQYYEQLPLQQQKPIIKERVDNMRKRKRQEEEEPGRQKRRKKKEFDIRETARVIFDPDALDERQLSRMGKKEESITFIVFEKGQLICAGGKSRDSSRGKSREESFKACGLVMKRLVACRSSLPENVKLERLLAEKKNKK